MTEAGQRLADRVGEALAQLAAAVADCANPDVIRISAAPTFASRWLAPRLTNFTEAHGLGVALDSAIDLRPAGSFDVAVRSGTGNWKGFSATKLFPVERTPLYNPKRYRPERMEEPVDLLNCRLIESDDWPLWFNAIGLRSPTVGSSGSGARYPTQDLAGTAAIEGGGLALLSPRLFENCLLAGELIQPFDIVVRGPEAYWLLVAEQEARPSILAFRDWLVRACAASRSGDRTGGS
ncbi:LysR substrate-binding domain-containing protein [Sphingomonas psychrotolerans]|uniref:LysR substrate-binding domain-containing protein n=1 Tax=Sphingomonas psychrotolerans TaxID=1327635 RepID=A0ABU3N1L9_9SPHN|nr:LysR substrate-binding domain-containing protein [Sphingomonas psychrotolerans]